MAYNLGPRGQRVYAALRDRIVSGEFAPGAQLPSHLELAAEFGVAPMTVRQAQSQLEREGLVRREQGRGTFVSRTAMPGVLIVEDDTSMRQLLQAHVNRSGYRAVEADGPAAALAALQSDPAIALVLSDVRMPTTQDGLDFIRTVRRRWPSLPLAAVTGHPDDLAGLHGTPECPVLILPKPIWARQIEEVLQLALRGEAATPPEYLET